MANDEATTSDVPWLLVGLIVLHVVFGLVALLLRAGHNWPVAMLWAGACAIVGSTIGFLFGIPRTLQGDQQIQRSILVHSNQVKNVDGQKAPDGEPPAESLPPAISVSNGDNYQLRVNTNLEQISDWLTKILVGVGLTQLSSIRGRLMSAASFIANGMDNTQPQITLALAMLIYFPVLGFLSGYLCTRLFLQPAFLRWDRGGLRGLEGRNAGAETKAPEAGGPGQARQAEAWISGSDTCDPGQRL